MARQSFASRVRQAVNANPTKTYDEIAQIVGCSVSTVAKYSHGRGSNGASGIASTDIADRVAFAPDTTARPPTKPIPLKRVALLLGKPVGRGSICDPNALIQIERDANGTTFTLDYVAKSQSAFGFFKNFRYLIRVEDTSDDACGSPLTRYTTLYDFKDNLVGGIDDVLRAATYPPHDTFGWKEPEDAHGLWEGDPPALDDFAEMIEPLEMAGNLPDRPILGMATIWGGEGPRKGHLLATDSYRLAVIRPAKPFAVTGMNLPVQPLRKFLDMTRASKQTTAPVEMSVGDIETFNARTNGPPEVKAPQTTTMRCGNVAVQVSIKPGDTKLGNPQDFPSVDRMYPSDLTDVFEVADAETFTKWIASHNKKRKDNIAVLTAGSTGERPTVEMRNYESSASFVSPDGKPGVTSKPTKWTSATNKIGFNPQYLADAIRHTGKHSAVSIALCSDEDRAVSPMKPVVVSAKTKPAKTKTVVDMLLMPVRLS